jgi:hypothetical protein
MDRKSTILGAVLLLIVTLAGCSGRTDAPDVSSEMDEHLTEEQQAFFQNLASLCGNAYEGRSSFVTEANRETMEGRRLLMNVESCSSEEIRVPFHVGDDQSRTWIITKTPEGLLFKHDHAGSIGTEDDPTNYGGYANGDGTARRQHFPADAETADMIPAAQTNIWTLEIGAEEFVYDLTRHGEPRFTAVFNLSTPVPVVQEGEDDQEESDPATDGDLDSESN